MKKKNIEIIMGVLLLFIVFYISRHAGYMASGQNVSPGKKQPVVVIDVGHGRVASRRKINY